MKICVTKGIRSLFVIIFMLLSICLTGFAQSTEDEGAVSDDQAIEAPEENTNPDETVIPQDEQENAQPMAAGDEGPKLIQPEQQISFENRDIVPKNELYTGSATYSIPIVTPPGRGGIAVPNLALVYNSQQKNGIFGMGFDLNLGYIQRSTKKGLHYNLNEFVFNGSTELVLVSGNIYQAKIEGDFTRYIYHGDGELQGWEVITKDGTIYYYGKSGGTQQHPSNGKVFKWYLTEIKDPNGNQLTISYIQNNNQLYPQYIDYSGNRVEFVTSVNPRSDKFITYESQYKIETDYFITKIDVKRNGELIRSYQLTYEQGANIGIFSRLKQVQVNSLPPIEFIWEDVSGNGEFKTPPKLTDLPTWPYQVYHLRVGDINGDGLSDVLQYGYTLSADIINVFLSNGDGTFQAARPTTLNSNADETKIWVADVNGDGKADLLEYSTWNTGSGDYMFVYLAKGDGTFEQTPKVTTLNSNADETKIWVADVNGDGKTDLLEYSTWNTGSGIYMFVYLAKSDGTFEQTPKVTTLNSNADETKIWLADVNGDGKTDLLEYSTWNTGSGIYMFVYLAKIDGTFEQTPMVTTLNPNADETKIWVADVNGDGLSDLLEYSTWNTGSGDYMFVYLAKGDGTFEQTPMVTTLNSNADEDKFWVADVNGDGKEDLLEYSTWASSSGYYMFTYLSKGDGTFEANRTTALAEEAWDVFFVDVTGDNLADMLQFRKMGQDLYTYQALGKADYLVKTIKNGLGGTATLEYKSSFTWLNEYLPFKVYTVSKITTNDGLGHNSAISYEYKNGYYDTSEREFRGFGEVTQINPNLTAEKTFFNQKDYYLKGRIEKVETRTTNSPSSPLMQRITNTWAKESLGGSYGRTFVKQNRKLMENFFSPTVSIQEDFTYYNTHGGVWTQITTSPSHPSPESITKTYEYQNYGSGTNGWAWRTTKETLSGSVSGKVRETYSTYYSTTGNLWTKTLWEDGKTIDQYPKVEMTYDSYGNVTSVKDALGNITSTEYESTNTYPDKITAPPTTFNGHPVNHITEALSYDYRCGKPTQIRDENLNVTSYVYDALGRLTQVNQPDGGQTAYTYYDSANPRYILTQAKEATGQYINKYEYYDGLNRKFQTVTYGAQGTNGTLAPIYSVTFYDNMGRAYREDGPYYSGGQTPYVQKGFDLFSRVISLTSADSTYGTVTTGISYSGLEITTTDPDTRQKKETKDYLGRTTKVTEFHESGQFVTNYTYNAAGDLRTITDHESNVITMTYDTLGRKTSMTHPDLGNWSYIYDKNNNLLTQTDAKGQVVTFGYDVLNRMVAKTYSTGQTAVYYIYDNDTSGLNGIGRLYATIQDTNPAALKGFKTENTYDVAGKTTSVLYPDSSRFYYQYYPGTGLLKNVLGADQATVYANLCLYEPTGKIGQVTSGNNVKTRYTYDQKSTRLTGIVTENQASVALQNRAYSYSKAGDITQVQDFFKNITYTYTYDNLHRLKGETINGGTYAPVSYTYSLTGNILTKTVGTGAPTFTYAYLHATKKHAVTSITYNSTAYSFIYDPNGNMTQGPDFTNPTVAQRRVAYDTDNMPTQVWASQSGVTTYFSYDGDGDRVKKTTSGGATIYYVGDHYEVKNDEALKYIFAGNLRLIMIKGTNTFYYHKDHLNSTSVMTDNSGAVVETAQYEPFGATRDHTGQDMSGYKFTDQELDNETNLYNYDARLYDPVIGRFGTADSVMQDAYDPQTLNAYAYCRNNPLIYTDPNGKSFKSNVLYGDFDSENLSWGGAIGQIVVGIIPYVGQAADVRDIAANSSNIYKDPGNGGAWIGLTGAIIGIVPLVGDSAKAIMKGVRKALTEVASETAEKTLKEGGEALSDISKKTRRQAFNEAKEQNNIPISKQPDRTIKPGTSEGEAAGLRPGENVRLHEYTNNKGQKIQIREDTPKPYSDGGSQGTHFNSGPSGEKLKKHHYFD